MAINLSIRNQLRNQCKQKVLLSYKLYSHELVHHYIEPARIGPWNFSTFLGFKDNKHSSNIDQISGCISIIGIEDNIKGIKFQTNLVKVSGFLRRKTGYIIYIF